MLQDTRAKIKPQIGKKRVKEEKRLTAEVFIRVDDTIKYHSFDFILLT